MKYIVTVDNAGMEEVFTFPRSIDHDAMAEVLGRIKNHTHGNWHRVCRKPVSAGFVTATGVCYGHSESLGLESRPCDTQLLASQYSL